MRTGRWAIIILLITIGIWALNKHYFSVVYDFNYRLTSNFEENGKPLTVSGVMRATLRRQIFRPLPNMAAATWDHQGEAIPVRFSNGALAFVAVKIATTDPSLGFNGTYPYQVFPLRYPVREGDSLPRVPIDLPAEYIPTIITFRDLNAPETAEVVPRESMERVAGKGTKFKSMTIEITDDPVDWRIEEILPWVTSKRESEKEKKPAAYVSGLGPNIRQYLYRSE